jgi:CheY-like chemotaxis protein
MAKRILIVEDESDIAAYLHAALVSNGFVPEIARDAPSALDKIKQARPDLISLDIMMPRESGLHMYQRLKADRATADIPVLIVTGAGHEDGFDFRAFVPDKSVPEPEGFMEKPVDLEAYLGAIRRLTAAGRKQKGQ